MKILVTGGCGFIGSNFILQSLSRDSSLSIVNLDKLTAVGNRENLKDIEDDQRYLFIEGDIADPVVVKRAIDGCSNVVHFAAESHVDRSILDPREFYRTNVEGTLVLLEEAKRSGVERFVHVSTDEVYGSLGKDGSFTEETPIAPNSPYAASKAASDLLVRSYFETYGFPAITTRCCNNYGPYQFPEKLIPLMIIRSLEDAALPVYGDGSNVRDWIHVEDHCDALRCLLERGVPGEVYNIGARSEKANLEIVNALLENLGKPKSLIRFVEDRPGHDWRYSVDPSKIERVLGWKPTFTLERGLKETVSWYVSNRDWWEAIRRRPSWKEFFDSWYGERLGDN